MNTVDQSDRCLNANILDSTICTAGMAKGLGSQNATNKIGFNYRNFLGTTRRWALGVLTKISVGQINQTFDIPAVMLVAWVADQLQTR